MTLTCQNCRIDFNDEISFVYIEYETTSVLGEFISITGTEREIICEECLDQYYHFHIFFFF